MTSDITILPLNPDTFEYQSYTNLDESLVESSELDTIFNPETDYIEYYVYDQNKNLIYPSSTVSLESYSVKDGDVLLAPSSDLKDLGYDVGVFNILYSFYRKRLASSITENYFIAEISSDRTEVRLNSNIIDGNSIITSTNNFIEYRETSNYFVDFYLNFGENQTVIANNIRLIDDETSNPSVLVKLYEPLPLNFGLKDKLWVVEQISTPQAYSVDFPFEPIIEDDFVYIQGPNFNLEIVGQTATSGEQFSYSTLINSNVTSSVNQIKSLLNEKEININIDYEDYSNFVNFSSAKTRLENFYYKVGLIESASNQLSTFLGQITTNTINTLAYSSSQASLTGEIDNIIKNFDGYEYFLYFNSGSKYSYPKKNTEPPFQLYSTGSTEVLEWIGNATPGTTYYGGQALSASNYDQDNRDWLYWSIPEYLRDDPQNVKYELFTDMVGQYYDNIWVYTKDITNKFNADNRLDYGISKDLVGDAIKDFAVKLYSNNFNTDDLFTAFLGLTPSGSSFPFPNITNSLPATNGYEYVNTQISASNDIVPLNDVNKRLYKRIYHNIPYLLKTKGTIAGIRALITSYGIPDTILRISEFGGKDRNESQDWDLKQSVFNYAFDTGISSSNFISASFQSDTNFGLTTPQSIQFRFKPSSIPTASLNSPSTEIRYSQSIFLAEGTIGKSAFIALEYTGSGLVSGSYSGSSIDPYDYYGTLKFFPESEEEPSLSASVYLPFFNGDWWSIQANYNVSNGSGSLYASNEIDGKIGFIGSSSVLIPSGSFAPLTSFDILGSYSSYVISEGGTYEDYINLSNLLNQFLGGNYVASTISYLNLGASTFLVDKFYKPFSGSFQELRYWNQEVSQSNFYDFTVNPYSVEGNGVNGTPDQLFFRAALGTQLNTGSRISIHPKVTGSLPQITQSFSDLTSQFYISGSEEWVPNIENIYQDQVPAGIKNRVTNKIQSENLILAEAPYGLSGSTAISSGVGNDSSTISPLESIQQTSFVSQSYTPSVNYLEVAFSPSNQINDDINAQIGYFNLGEYIGDPRFISSSDYSYPDLDRLRNAYFEKYIKSYDVVDFIRLIKFFDNSLFKMIKDFTPARTSLASGVVVKQHILERNRQRPAQVNSSFHQYSGSIKSFPKDYNTGSSDEPQYSTSGSAIYKFSGGAGGSFNIFNGMTTSPSGSLGNGPNNRFFLTQSYNETISGPLGSEVITISNQDEFYNGEFSGSDIIVTTQSLNPACDPYLRINTTPLTFNPLFFSFTPTFEGTVDVEEFIKQGNHPTPGSIWIASTFDSISQTSKVNHIRISSTDINGNLVRDYIQPFENLSIQFPDTASIVDYYVNSVTTYVDSLVLGIDQNIGDNNITGSINGGSENWSLEVMGNYTSSDNITSSADNLQQGKFLKTTTNQFQNIAYWNGDLTDPQSFFNTGSESITTSEIVEGTSFYNYGSYNPQRTSNIPWLFSCSIAYSASTLPNSTQVTASGVYHTASSYSAGVGLFDQNFTLSASSQEGSFIPATNTSQTSTLDPNIFETGVNTLIPGNSGSGNGVINTALAGHPQIKTAGTASMDFYFPSLTLDGTIPITTSGTPTTAALSGSTLKPGNGDFFLNSFDEDVLSFSGSGGNAITRDGAINWEINNVSTYLETQGYNDPIIVTGATINFNGNIDTTATNVTSSFARQTSNKGNTFQTVVGTSTNSDTNGNISFTGKSFTLNKDLSETQNFRLELTSPEENFDYELSSLSATLDLNFTEAGVPTSENGIPAIINYTQSNSDNEFTSSFQSGTATLYATTDLQVHLKSTGSNGKRIITSSLKLEDVDIHEGKTFTFPDSPILDIQDTTPAPNSDRTLNTIGEIYYLEYEFTNYTPGTGTGFANTPVNFFPNGDTGSAILITQSFEVDASDYALTGSVRVTNGDATVIESFILDSETAVDRFSFTGSFEYPFNYDDNFRMGIGVSKSFASGLVINEYTMSIFPSSSKFSPIDSVPALNNFKIPTGSNIFIPTFYGGDILPFNRALDCQPLLNNYTSQRENTFIMDVDYNNESGPVIPVNQNLILSGSALKAAVPDSNYSQLSSITPRYKGAKSTSKKLNTWSIGDVGTYGKNPTLELRDAFFGYFNDLSDPYPNINGLTQVNLNYLIDEQGNALPPSLNQLSIDTFGTVFPPSTLGKIAVRTGSQDYKVLGSPSPILSLMEYVTPIMYSQNSGDNYSPSIPLSGSGYISRYDNDDANSQIFAQFMAAGTASVVTTQPTQSVDYYLDPSETNNSPAGASSPYTSSTGLIEYPAASWGDLGNDLSNQQVISLQTSVVTSYVSERSGIRKDLTLELHLYSGSGANDEVSFNLEYVHAKIHTDDGQTHLIKNVENFGWFELSTQESPSQLTARDLAYEFANNRFNSSTLPIGNTGMKFYIDWLMFETLWDRGITRERILKSSQNILGIEWMISANSGKYNIKVGDKMRWQIRGEFATADKENQQGYFFPSTYTGEYTPVKLQGQGVYDHLLSDINTAQAPFWVFTGSAGGGSNTLDQKILVMSSSNINEAYGTSFYQGDLPYYPGFSPYFPGNIEPRGTNFDKITNPLELEEGDEIRFANNENFTYKILKVHPPQENIESGGTSKSRLKIELDKEVPLGVNKDFFLVRRKVANPNLLYLDTPFPYKTLSSASINQFITSPGASSSFGLTGSQLSGVGENGSYTASYNDLEISTTPGILYPDFPTEYLVQSASIIVNDLITRRIIES